MSVCFHFPNTPTVCLVNKPFLIAVLLFSSSTSVHFSLFFLQKGTPAGVLCCREARVQFSWSAAVCFHSFLRFSSCPQKQCTDTLWVDLNHGQCRGLGGAGRSTELFVLQNGVDINATWPEARWPGARRSSLLSPAAHTCQVEHPAPRQANISKLKHLRAGIKNKLNFKEGWSCLHFHGCEVDRSHQKGCNI